jgi:hypothetical protein
VKDIRTHATLLEGRSEHGLYPLRFQGSSFTSTNRSFPTFTALLGFRTTLDVWHSRLGYSSISTVNHVIKAHHLPLSSNKINKFSFCDFCQLGKGKQLPFTPSSRISTKPLELIHTKPLVYTHHPSSIWKDFPMQHLPTRQVLPVQPPMNRHIIPLQQQNCQPCITLIIIAAYILQEREASQHHKESSAAVVPNLCAT